MGPSESAETGGPCRAQERPGAAQEHGAGFNAREVPKLPSERRQLSTAVWYRFFGKRSKYSAASFLAAVRSLVNFLADERVS